MQNSMEIHASIIIYTIFQKTKLKLPNFGSITLSKKILTNFKNSFTDRLSVKFAVVRCYV